MSGDTLFIASLSSGSSLDNEIELQGGRGTKDGGGSNEGRPQHLSHVKLQFLPSLWKQCAAHWGSKH